MHKKTFSPVHALIVVFVLVGLALTGCGPETLVVGLEPTPTPVLRSRTNDTYGFSFHYPETWTLADEPHLLRLSRGTLKLNIAYGWASHPGFSPMGGRTGIPAGDLNYRDKIFFLDGTIPAEVLEFEGRDKMVLYGGTGPVEAGDLVFSMWLEDAGSTPYDEVDIPQVVQSEAKGILETFERISGAGQSLTPGVAATVEPAAAPTESASASAGESPPPLETSVYENATYGFSFEYPTAWIVEEVAGETVGESMRLADSVVLTRDEFVIVVQFQRKSDPGPVAWGGDLVPGGTGYAEATLGERVALLGEETYQSEWRVDGELKAVEVNTHGESSDLILSITLADGSARLIQDDEAASIPDDAMAALDQVLSSFAVSE